MAHPTPVPPSEVHKPRILALHGGGVSASIFRLQSRALLGYLAPHFRLVFADAPFLCGPGPNIIPVYANMGPYRRWLRWLHAEHPEISDEELCEELEHVLREAMREDDDLGGRGDWCGTLGFSQGAKIAASLAWDWECRVEAEERRLVEERRRNTGGEKKKKEEGKKEREQLDGMYATFSSDEAEEESDDADVTDEHGRPPAEYVTGMAGGQWRFAIALAGRAPLMHLSPATAGYPFMGAAGSISEGALEFDLESNRETRLRRVPTMHVHGLLDPGLELHRRLLDGYCAGYGGDDARAKGGKEGDRSERQRGMAETMEWQGDHRVPLKKADVTRLAEGIVRCAQKAGVLSSNAVVEAPNGWV